MRAARGLPPTPPDGTFDVDIGDVKAKVRYVWVELGQEYREDHGLSNASEGAGELWRMLAATRDKALPLRNWTPILDIATFDVCP